MSETKLQARISDAGVLQVCRHVDGKPTEEWREPVMVTEIAAILPTFTRNALDESVSGPAESERIYGLIEKTIESVVAADKKPRDFADLPGGVLGNDADGDFEAEDAQTFMNKDGGPARQARVARPAFSHRPQEGAQFVPFLKEGGYIVSLGHPKDLDAAKLVLRFNVNTGLPQVAPAKELQAAFSDWGHFDGFAAEPLWRTPTKEECVLFADCISPETSIDGLVGLYRREDQNNIKLMHFTAFAGLVDIGGLRERIPMGFFDVLCDEHHPLQRLSTFGAEGKPAQFRLFQGANVGQGLLTNMSQGGSFPSDQTALIDELVVEVKLAPGFIGEARKAALATVRAGLQLAAVIGVKPFCPMPAQPEYEGSLDGAAAYRYPVGGDQGLAVPARQGFAVDVLMSAAAKEILSITGSRVKVWIKGQLTRDVQ